MTNKDDAAFAAGADSWNQPGLTKREYFAAMALQGILANADQVFVKAQFTDIGEMAVQAADALLKALNENE